jgi:hypothetical protein
MIGLLYHCRPLYAYLSCQQLAATHAHSTILSVRVAFLVIRWREDD